MVGQIQGIDFFLWPRNDIDKIMCLLFSRWKGDKNSEYKLIQVKFELGNHDYEKQLLRLASRKECTGLIINNASQSQFLFVDKCDVQVQFSIEQQVRVWEITSGC